MSHRGVSVEEIARLAGHSSSRTTETIYRRELRPVITTGAEIMDQIFAGENRDRRCWPSSTMIYIDLPADLNAEDGQGP